MGHCRLGIDIGEDAALRVLESVPAAVRDWGKHQIYERIQGIARLRRALGEG